MQQKSYEINMDDLKKSISELPKKEKRLFTINEIVKECHKQIKLTLKMGYTFKDFCELILIPKGIKISPNVLKTTYESLDNKVKRTPKSEIKQNTIAGEINE